MRSRHFTAAAMILAIGLFGCDREPVPTPAPTPPAASPSAGGPPPAVVPSAPPVEMPSPTLAKPQAAPEDITLDAARETKVRAKAAELGALAVIETKNLTEGSEVYVLVRGDKGGGTIYGSGPYTADSQVRRAAIHAGAVKDRELGIVKLKYAKYDGTYSSVPANGIVPTQWSKFRLSFTIEKVDVP